MGLGVLTKIKGALHPRQVQALIDGYTVFANLSWTIGSATRTVPNATFNTAYFSGKGRNGISLPNQRTTSFDTAGLLCSNEGWLGTGRIRLATGTLTEQCNPETGANIYADIFQEANGDFTITLKQRDPVSGVLSDYIAQHNGYSMCFLYRYNLHQLTTLALVLKDASIAPKPSAISALDSAEILTVTAVDTLSALTTAARLTNGVFLLKVNNVMFDNLAGSGVTVSGTTVTWNAALTGVTLNPGDRVVAYYKAARRF